MDKDFICLILFGVIWFGYIVYLSNGWFWDNALKPRPYTLLFNNNIYIIHVVCATLIAVAGYCLRNIVSYHHMLYAPLLFLILFKLADLISVLTNHRHIVVRRLDKSQTEGITEDNFGDFLLQMAAIGLSMFLCAMLPATL